METYLFKFSACLAIFWLVYVLLLERQKMHRFKRFYLLGAFIAALIIPSLTITKYIEPIVNDFEFSSNFIIPVESSVTHVPVETPPFWDLEAVLWLIYGLGVLLFSIRFVVNLAKMHHRISKNETIIEQSFIYVLLKECRIPHSFFKYLFFNKDTYNNNAVPKEVLLHEQSHAKQLHSLDIIGVEILQIIFWFHPLIYILKHHIKLNHEFLADQAVLGKGIDTKTYQNILLQFSSSTQNHQLSSAINYSSIKKRFTVMKTQTSKTRIWVSSFLLLPIIAILFYSFAEREYVQKDQSTLEEDIANELRKANELQLIYLDGASEKLMQEYRNFISTYKESNIIIGDKYERAIIIYDELMSDKQRSSVEKYPEKRFPLRSLSKVEPKQPTSAQFESWKDGNKFAIWIDSKHVPNSELNNYSVSDIEYFIGSKVYKNARSKKFPQPFQFNLYTKKGFQKNYKEADIIKYRKHTELYSKAIDTYLKGSQTDNSELKILKAQADKLYNSFTKEELKNYNILPAPPVPTDKNSKSSKEVKNYLKEQMNQKKSKGGPNNSNQYYPVPPPIPENATPSERKKMQQAINDFEKKYKRKVHTSKNIETGEIISLIANDDIYEPEETQEKVTAKQIAAYNAWAKKIHSESKALSKNATFYPPINEQDFIKFSEIYKRMSLQQKNQVVEYPFPGLISQASTQEKATKKQVAEYNKLAKHCNSQLKSEFPIIKVKDVKRVEYLYGIMSEDQKKNAESYPDFSKVPPPPPPAPPAPERATVIEIAEYDVWAKKMNAAIKKAESANNKSYYPRIKKEDYDKYYNIYSNLMTEAHRETAEPWPNIPPPPPPPTSAPETSKVIKGDEQIPPPPPPPTKEAEYKNTQNNPLTYKTEDGEIIEVVEVPEPQQPKSINVLVNGKKIEAARLKMTKKEIRKLKLSLSNSTIESFKVKIPGIKTQNIKGNSINGETIKKINITKSGSVIAIFDIKDDKNSKISPLIIEIID